MSSDMVELVRIYSATYFSSYDSLGERKLGRKYRNPNFRWFCQDLENFARITQKSICVFPSKVPVFYRTLFWSVHRRSILRRKCSSVESSIFSYLVNNEEAGMQTNIEESGLAALDINKNVEFGVTGIVSPSIILQNFKVPELKIHYLEEGDEEILSKRILSLSRSNKVRSALELYLSMDVTGLRASTHACNSLLTCLVRNWSIDDALLVFGLLRSKGLATGHSYSLILNAVASVKGSKEAIENFNTFENDGVSSKVFDIVVYNTMISICGKARNWVDAERLWRKFKQINMSGTMITYSLLISVFVQCGQTELAVGAYHEMTARGLEPDEDILKAIVASCTRDGKWHFALHIFKKMLENGIKPSVITFNSVINCLGKSGEDTLAFRVYELMNDFGLKPDVYTCSALLTTLYSSMRYVDALKLFESFRTLLPSQSHFPIYNIALLSCQRLGLWERSLQLLWQMEKSGMEISSVSYNHVIRACEAARKPEVAIQVYQRMIEQKLKPDTFTYLSLLRACIWGSLWTEIEKLLECIPLDASLCNALVQGFCLRGKIHLAKKMYTKMRRIGLSSDGKTRAMVLQYSSANRKNQNFRNQSFSKKVIRRCSKNR